jgi:hypothetical protein
VKKEEINRVQTENYADSSFSKTPAIWEIWESNFDAISNNDSNLAHMWSQLEK